MDSIEKISRLCLVACDQSYWGGPDSNTPDVERGPITEGTVLAPCLDSRGPNADLFPNTMPAGFYDPVFTGLSQWVVVNRTDDPITGFGATIYTRTNINGKADYMVAFQGTRGPNAQDWAGNFGLALDKWTQAAAGQRLRERLRTLLNGPDGNQITGDIYFTGQSLGGGLAEYAVYDFYSDVTDLQIPGFPANRIALVTFNGLGGIAGLQKITVGRDTALNLAQLANVTTRHYWVVGDLVHRLGEGTGALTGQVHLNGQGNAYRLDFFARSERDDPSIVKPKPDMVDGKPRWSSFIDAHRLESGFYSGINRAAPGFSFSANPQDIVPLHITGLSLTAMPFGNLYNSYDSARDGEATARIIATLMYGFAFGDQEDVKELVDNVGESLYRSAVISKKKYEILRKSMPGMLRDFSSSSAGVKLQMRSLILGSVLDSFEQSDVVSQETRDTIAKGSDLYTDTTRYPPNPTLDVIRQLTLAKLDKSVGQSDERIRVAYEIARKVVADSVADPALYPEVRRVTQQHLDELIPLLFEENGFKAFGAKATYLVAAAHLDAAVFAGQVVGYVQSLLKDMMNTVDVSTSTRSGYAREAIDLLREIARGLVSAVPDFVRGFVVPEIPFEEFQSGTQQHRAIKAFLGGLKPYAETAIGILTGSSEAHGAEADQALNEIETLVTNAAEIVVIRPDREQNPFDDPAYDPDASAVSTASLAEGGIAAFTAYLPYEALAGGQRVRFELSGVAADKLTLTDKEVDLGADGTFTLTVAEGQREISFGIAALEDVDADATLTLSATLVAMVDGMEVATHETHEEATITLSAHDETPPSTTLELHGDWGLKLYPAVDAYGAPVLDAEGNQVLETRVDTRFPHLFNLERDVDGSRDFGEQGHWLTGSDGADRIWLGESGGANGALGLGGDDYLTGMANVPNLIEGDQEFNFNGYIGNDTIEGGENLRPYTEGGITRLGEHIEGIGDDIIYGGAGDDQLYADRIALLDETLDPHAQALDQKGDWISGEQGNDRIFGSAAHDVLFGGGGDDVIYGGAGNDVLDGDDNYYNWGDAWWEVEPGRFDITFFPVTNINVTGYPLEYYKVFGGDDILDGGPGDDLILGMIGDDTLIGGDGDDVLQGWEGDDRLFGGAGADRLFGDFGRDELPGTRTPMGSDNVMPGAMGAIVNSVDVEQVGNDFLDGGAGDDILVGEAGDDTLLGGDGADTLLGDADYLDEALHGDDLLDGGAGADTLAGFGGEDRLYGGSDDDSISGNEGNDFADGGTGNDEVWGGAGDDMLMGGAGDDVIAGESGADELHGGKGKDDLEGGEGDDVLYGEEGTDQLFGGAGDDALYGGSGDDVISGGDGQDLIDGGSGADMLRGGAGDDTYALGVGYGNDRIEDHDGSNRIRFGFGVAADDLSASLEDGTLAATINVGFGGDSVTFSMTALQVSGADFADGTSWTSRQWIQLVPALKTAGSQAGEALTGNPFVRNELQGFGGDDAITGSANDDLLEGGEGADTLDGAAGSDVYVFNAGDTGVDALADSGIEARAYLGWFYGSQGISDWVERGAFGGMYRGALEGESEEGFVRYYESYEEAYAELPGASISFIEPLETIAPVVRRDAAAALDALVEAGVVSRDVVEFGPGLALSDLTLTVTVNQVEAADHPDQPWFGGGTLAVRWGDAGFDIKVPGVNYEFVGSNLHTEGSDPGFDVPGEWRGYRLGEGIEAFRFAGGSVYSMEEFLQHASVSEVPYDYSFVRGSGPQVISRQYEAVAFEDGILPDEVSVSRDGTDLLITLSGGGAQGRIERWYENLDLLPSVALKFSSGDTIDAATLTEMGLHVRGGEGDDIIIGLDGFNDVLSGGPGNDVLTGGTGKDTYVFMRGDGIDTITDVPSGAGDPDASVVVFPDLYQWEMSWSLGSLRLNFQSGDAIHFSAFDPSHPYDTPVFERLEFADGTTLTYEELLAQDFWLNGTDDDDVISGTALNDQINGGAGNDILSGLEGDDSIEGGDGDDTLIGGPGSDYVAGGSGSDTYLYSAGDGHDDLFDWSETEGDEDKLRLLDLRPLDVRVTQDPTSYYLVIDADNQILLDTMAQEPAAAIERIEFTDGTVWSPADLAARVELLPATPGDDVLWGTTAHDILNGLDGGDSLYGNEGDDILIGGEGQDYYYFAAGDGNDRIENSDSDGSPDLLFFADAASTDATLKKAGIDLVIRIGDDSVALAGWYGEPSGSSYQIIFQTDGAYWDDATLSELAPMGGNSAPELQSPIDDQTAAEDGPFSFTLPPGTFFDPDPDDTLTYSASLVDGSSLPTWLSFDPETGTFWGVPLQADVGSIDVQVTATDIEGSSVSDDFSLQVTNTNDIPTVANVIGEYSFEAGSKFSFAVPAGTFADEDEDDHLDLSAALYGGGALPAWLSFDPATNTFTGNPGKKENGISRVVVTATDAEGASVDSDFGLVVRAKVGSTVTGSKDDDVLYGSTGNETLSAKDGNDALFAGAGDDLLKGGTGNDILQGGEGEDVLRGGTGENLLDGGAGDDVIYGGKGSSLIAGGTGNDTIRTGSGSDVILFNRGDGSDTVIADREGDNTLSFGGGIRYSDLSLSRIGKDLIVSAGETDQVLLRDWYGIKHSVLNLQFIPCGEYDAGSDDPLRNHQVQTFDFLGLVGAFDSARKASPGLTSWAVTNALLQFHLSGADDFALGGDLAYWYAKNRGFGGISASAAQQVLGAASFGAEAQALRPFGGLQEGFVKLS